MFRRGGSPRTTNWNPGVFFEPRGAHLPRSALSLSTTTTTSPKICSRIVLCSPREEILLCEILLCGSWQSRADGWAVVMNYKSYCYRGATAAAEGDLRITPLQQILIQIKIQIQSFRPLYSNRDMIDQI